MILNPKLNEIVLSQTMGLDTEFNSLDILNSDCLAISLCNDFGEVYVIDRSKYTNKELSEFFKQLSLIKMVICHNTKVDIGIIYSNFGVLLRNGYCTMLASQIIDNGYVETKNMVGKIPVMEEGPHSLGGNILRYLGEKLNENSEKKRLQKSFIGLKLGTTLSEEQLNYAGNDAMYLIPLYKIQQTFIEARNLQAIVKLENTLTPVLIKIEFRGCLIDVNKHKKNIKDWEASLKSLNKDLDSILVDLSKTYPQISGGRFTNERRYEKVTQLDMFGGGVDYENKNKNNINYSSSKQIEDIFTRLELPKPTDDEGKISFGENPIKTYINNHPDSILKKFLEVLLDYREYDKLLGTYGEKLFDMLDPNNRVRTSYGQCFTDTGRLTSSEIIKKKLGLNLANIPKRKDIRSIFVPDEGYSFVDSDFTGQEVILAGDYSKEPVLMKAFQEGFDHHSYLASISYSIVFGKDFKVESENKVVEVDGHSYNLKTELRENHKSCLFAKFYGGGKMRVMNVLNKYLVNHVPAHLREKKADEISKALNNALPILTAYLRTKVDEVKEYGFVIANKLGRRRYFDIPDSAFGDAMNFPIQGSGADCVKISLIKIDKWLGEKSKELGISEEELGWITMTIYDQNLVCISDKYLDLAPEIPRLMAESINYFLTDLKGSSDLNIRKFWAK